MYKEELLEIKDYSHSIAIKRNIIVSHTCTKVTFYAINDVYDIIFESASELMI